MQTLEIRLEGEFYDSFIYSGRLYLWTLNQSIIALNWDELVESLAVSKSEELALECAFRRSSLLYQSDIAHVLNDDELKPIVIEKFKRLGQHPRELTQAYWSMFIVREIANPLPFPHADITIYSKELFVGSSQGIWRGDIRRTKTQRLVSQKLERIWDGPCFDVAISNYLLAIASGSEGAYQANVSDDNRFGVSKEPEQVYKDHTQSVEWLYGSVFCSSDTGGVLVEYSPYEHGDRNSRQFREIIDTENIFKDALPGWYAWGAKEKLCAASESELAIARYRPYLQIEEDRIEPLVHLNLERKLSGSPLRADSSFFGFVLETDDGLLVVGSNDESLWIGGELVNWRLFRTSIDYVNQLHIVWDSYLSIMSFNDDYLVTQKDKTIGLSNYGGQRQTSRRADRL